MLLQIHVRNFAIIDQVELEFGNGMNVLTGETGAGKSILIDALGLLLGNRASADVIRTGETRAEISASFSVASDSGAAEWLAEQALDGDDACHLRRVISTDGRARGFINGNPVPMQSLRELGERLVSIHGQHEHQTLQHAANQRDLLDARGGLTATRAAVESAHAQWVETNDAVEALQSARHQREDRLAFLRFQLAELDALDLKDGELATLEPERLRLANAERLSTNANAAIDALYERDAGNAQSLLSEAARALSGIAEFDPALTDIIAVVDEAEVNVNEAADALRRYQANIESDPARQEQVEQRLASIQSLARKHLVDPEALGEQIGRLRDELETLEHADEHLEQRLKARDQALAQLVTAAAKLTRARRKAAKQFATEVTRGMQSLGMPGGVFSVVVDDDAKQSPARHGADRIQFLVSANPGQPPQPIAKVASGGELSRISLAIQVAAGRDESVASMIFDEVDSGVGGGVAEIVGQQMRELAIHCQVLAVTHLPQVAGQAHHHHKVAKMTDGKTTRTTITTLSEDARVEEIARMLGGVSITDTSREHAKEMLARG